MMGNRDPIVMRWECMNHEIVLWLARKNTILFHSLNELRLDMEASYLNFPISDCRKS